MDNRSPEVDAWFETYDNPQKELVQAGASVDREQGIAAFSELPLDTREVVAQPCRSGA